MNKVRLRSILKDITEQLNQLSREELIAEISACPTFHIILERMGIIASPDTNSMEVKMTKIIDVDKLVAWVKQNNFDQNYMSQDRKWAVDLDDLLSYLSENSKEVEDNQDLQQKLSEAVEIIRQPIYELKKVKWENKIKQFLASVDNVK